ncbi:hypothetical protein [Ruegeria sp.]|uniref:hypothetical protein n=1 Tax=Ruegeria sp. TaxID=1879320 RepID=UPI003B00A259
MPTEGPIARFEACPIDLLKASYAAMLAETVQDVFAVEAEVLRLCRERQELINAYLRADLEAAALLALPVPAPGPVSESVPEQAGEQDGDPIPPAAQPSPRKTLQNPDQAPDQALSATTHETSAHGAFTPPEAAPAAGSDPGGAPVISREAPPGAALPASSPDGNWTHLVRYRVRHRQGPWRAEIASIHTPPPPPPVETLIEGGRTVLTTPPAPPPDPALYGLFVAGDALPDGQIITAITEAGVFILPQGAQGRHARRLRPDPGAQGEDGQDGSAGSDCPMQGYTARDFRYCRVTGQ